VTGTGKALADDSRPVTSAILPTRPSTSAPIGSVPSASRATGGKASYFRISWPIRNTSPSCSSTGTWRSTRTYTPLSEASSRTVTALPWMTKVACRGDRYESCANTPPASRPTTLSPSSSVWVPPSEPLGRMSTRRPRSTARGCAGGVGATGAAGEAGEAGTAGTLGTLLGAWAAGAAAMSKPQVMQKRLPRGLGEPHCRQLAGAAGATGAGAGGATGAWAVEPCNAAAKPGSGCAAGGGAKGCAAAGCGATAKSTGCGTAGAEGGGATGVEGGGAKAGCGGGAKAGCGGGAKAGCGGGGAKGCAGGGAGCGAKGCDATGKGLGGAGTLRALPEAGVAWRITPRPPSRGSSLPQPRQNL
jgi:hypothetical protein